MQKEGLGRNHTKTTVFLINPEVPIRFHCHIKNVLCFPLGDCT